MASATTNPTAGLQSALDDFQGVLSKEDKTKLQRIKGTPNADSVIQFTALLDRENTQRRGSSIATRLYPILLSVQQFSGIVDTFASSNPAIAALVWGVVKLTMLVTANFASYFEELSKTFFDFDKWSPRFNEYQPLFPSSTRLQLAICDFHASIVRCCKTIVEAVRRPWQLQLVNVLRKSFQAEVQSHVRLIQDRALEVKYEIGLAKAQAAYREQQHPLKEGHVALAQWKSLLAFVGKADAGLDEASTWRSLTEQRRKVKLQRPSRSI